VQILSFDLPKKLTESTAPGSRLAEGWIFCEKKKHRTFCTFFPRSFSLAENFVHSICELSSSWRRENLVEHGLAEREQSTTAAAEVIGIEALTRVRIEIGLSDGKTISMILRLSFSTEFLNTYQVLINVW